MIGKERYVWVDYAKFFSISLVVSVHCQPELPYAIGSFLALLRMPAFFLISGFLFDQKKFPTYTYFFKHRSKQLLVPYFYFTLFFYVLWLIAGRYLGSEEDANSPFYQPIIEFVIGRPELIVRPFWFICCLFSIQTIHYFLSKHLNEKQTLAICLLMPFINNITNYTELPFEIDMAFRYIPFYAISNYAKNILLSTSQLTKKTNAIASLFLLLSILLYLIYMKSENPCFVTLLRTTIGIFILPAYIIFCSIVSKLFKRNKFIEYIGKNAIVILALQTYIIKIIELCIFKSAGTDFFEQKYYLNIAMTITVIILSYYPILFINKYIPFIIGRNKKN